jgi:hypothetical protein
MSQPLNNLREEILYWMNYGIPFGKTIPIFEDLVDKLISSELKSIEKEVEGLKPPTIPLGKMDGEAPKYFKFGYDSALSDFNAIISKRLKG